ncbi:MAG: pyridoxal-phosphate dependent enzyme [Saprospiraceae bacterium]|nr:pyridoxal-phosphate dependent enzyme [Saprospiraceae bacterium]
MSKELHYKTPLFFSNLLSNRLNKKIYFKMDCYQPTGSFKIRGVGKRCQEAAKKGCKHFIIASGGNAGLAVAYSGWKMKIKTTVVVPETTQKPMCEKISDLGAMVIIHGKVWDESNLYAQKLCKQESATYIHPFDHPTIWDGNASVIDECAPIIEAPDYIIVAVGGGGYFCGIIEGLIRNNWNKTKIIAAETIGTASLQKAISAGKLITLDKIESIASSLASKKVAPKALELALKYNVKPYTVNDKKALEACYSFLNENGCLVEPACGAALSVVYQNSKLIDDAKSIMVMVCGGRSISFEKFKNLLGEFNCL